MIKAITLIGGVFVVKKMFWVLVQPGSDLSNSRQLVHVVESTYPKFRQLALPDLGCNKGIGQGVVTYGNWNLVIMGQNRQPASFKGGVVLQPAISTLQPASNFMGV